MVLKRKNMGTRESIDISHKHFKAKLSHNDWSDVGCQTLCDMRSSPDHRLWCFIMLTHAGCLIIVIVVVVFFRIMCSSDMSHQQKLTLTLPLIWDAPYCLNALPSRVLAVLMKLGNVVDSSVIDSPLSSAEGHFQLSSGLRSTGASL